MAKYIRKWDCGCCGSPVIYDEDTKEIRCRCGDTKVDLGSDVKDPRLWTKAKVVQLY